MKKSDWVTVRLLRKMLRQDPRAAMDDDVRRAALYLYHKYGEKHFNKCCDALNREASSN